MDVLKCGLSQYINIIKEHKCLKVSHKNNLTLSFQYEHSPEGTKFLSATTHANPA